MDNVGTTVRQAFVDEMEKISAQKCRSGRRPIRADNLAGKSHYDGTKKKLTKLSSVASAASSLRKLTPKLKTVGLVGGSAAGTLAAQQAYRDWQLGRTIRKQQGG